MKLFFYDFTSDTTAVNKTPVRWGYIHSVCILYSSYIHLKIFFQIHVNELRKKERQKCHRFPTRYSRIDDERHVKLLMKSQSNRYCVFTAQL